MNRSTCRFGYGLARGTIISWGPVSLKEKGQFEAHCKVWGISRYSQTYSVGGIAVSTATTCYYLIDCILKPFVSVCFQQPTVVDRTPVIMTTIFA